MGAFSELADPAHFEQDLVYDSVEEAEKFLRDSYNNLSRRKDWVAGIALAVSLNITSYQSIRTPWLTELK